MQEKRQDQRFQKKYTVIFSLKDNPQKAFDISGLVDISKGGLKFTSYENFTIGQVINFQIKFPFLYPQVTMIDGKVISVNKIPESIVHKVSVEFVNLHSDVILILNQMEEINQKSK